MIITIIALMAREDSIPYVGKDLNHNGQDGDMSMVDGDDGHDYDDTSSYFFFSSGNKAYQAGKDLDALYLYSQVSLVIVSQVSLTCQVSQVSLTCQVSL